LPPRASGISAVGTGAADGKVIGAGRIAAGTLNLGAAVAGIGSDSGASISTGGTTRGAGNVYPRNGQSSEALESSAGSVTVVSGNFGNQFGGVRVGNVTTNDLFGISCTGLTASRTLSECGGTTPGDRGVLILGGSDLDGDSTLGCSGASAACSKKIARYRRPTGCVPISRLSRNPTGYGGRLG